MILTLFVGLLCFTYQAKAQWTVIDPSNLVQNIKSAVQSSTTATNMVKSLQESIKIYNQSKAYYDALKSVHNIIKDARKVKLTRDAKGSTLLHTTGGRPCRYGKARCRSNGGQRPVLPSNR